MHFNVVLITVWKLFLFFSNLSYVGLESKSFPFFVFLPVFACKVWKLFHCCLQWKQIIFQSQPCCSVTVNAWTYGRIMALGWGRNYFHLKSGRFLSSLSFSVCRSSVRASNLQTLLMVIIKVWQMSPISGCFTVYWLITSHMQHTVRRYGCLDICGDVSFEFLIYSSMKLSKRNWKDCDYMFLQGIFRSDVRVITVGCYNADPSTLLSRLSQSLMSRAVCAA